MLQDKKSQFRLAGAFGALTLVLVSLCLVALYGCGGGGGPSPTTKLSGTVTAPQGTPVAQAPSFLQRLASLLISVAEAQALTGQAVANATVKAFIWPNVPQTVTTPIATTQTDNNGRYTLQLPANAVGKDVVVIAEKSVEGGTLRLSTIAADVPKEGKVGVNLDAATTLATEQIVFVAKNQNISDFSANAISVIFSEVSEIVSQLAQLNLIAGAEDSPIPQEFGTGLVEANPIAQQVAMKVKEQQENLPPPTNPNVATAKSIVQMLRDFGISLVNLPTIEAETIQSALNEQQKIINSEIQIAEEFLERINFPKRVLGWDNMENNPGISPQTGIGQGTATVRGDVYNVLNGSPAANATVDAYIGGQKVKTVQTDNNGDFEMQLSIGQATRVTFVATSGNFIGTTTQKVYPGEENWVYLDLPTNNLLGLPPGHYRELWTNDPWMPRILERTGDATDNRTWVVEVPQAGKVSGSIRSRQGTEVGMILTVTVQNHIGIFRYTHEAGKYIFQVRKSGDASLQYDGSVAVTTDAQGNPTQIALSATVKDSALKSPITFSGTLQGTPAQTGTVTGSIRSLSPTIAHKKRSRQASGGSIAPYTEAKFVNVSLQSQFGSASIGELKVVWLRDTLEPEKIKQISLTNLRASSQTSKPVSLVINNATIELQETTPEEKQQYKEDLKPKTATFSATVEGSGLRLQVSNLQASDFVFVKVGERWNWWHWEYEPVYRPIPRKLSGQINYSSPTLQFSGSVNANWENLQGPEPEGFGEDKKPVALSLVPKGTFVLDGSWRPNIGRPAGINLQLTSNPQGLEPQVQVQLTLNYGDQQLSGTIKGTLDIRNGQSYGFKSGDLDMTHTPSKFKVKVSKQKDQPVSGQILTDGNQKVADIGEARNLGLPDLGSAVIVKYTDKTFETLESILPRSRMSRR